MKDHLNPYWWPTFPRELADFPIIDNRAQIAQDSGIRDLEGYKSIGRMSGEVVELASGLQMLQAFGDHSTPAIGMKLFGSAHRDTFGSKTHMYYEHGTKGRRKDSIVALDRRCPGCELGLDCGCRNNTDRIVSSVYGRSPSSAAYLAVDPYTTASERLDIARSILDMRGLRSSPYIYTTPGFDGDCSTMAALKNTRGIYSVINGQNDSQFMLTNDISVTFMDGNPARLIVLEEPYKRDKGGFAGMQSRHYVLIYGDITKGNPIFRLHSKCSTAEYGGNGCDCRYQREETQQRMLENGSGIFLYEDREGMGTGMINKWAQTGWTGSGEDDLRRARTKRLGLPGDMRQYDLIEVVHGLTGITSVTAVTANKQKIAMMEQGGIEVVQIAPITIQNVTLFASQAITDFRAKHNQGRYHTYVSAPHPH